MILLENSLDPLKRSRPEGRGFKRKVSGNVAGVYTDGVVW